MLRFITDYIVLLLQTDGCNRVLQIYFPMGDKMKKNISFISFFLLLAAALSAEVTVKKLDNGKAEVRFFYANPRAQEVLLAGSFTNWQDGALLMTKIEEKGWEYVGEFSLSDELKYKFISDGSWTTDLRAPDLVDDGFGGKNGLVVVSDLIEDEAADAGAGKTPEKKAKIAFSTWTMLGMQSKFDLQSYRDPRKKGFDFDNATVGVKSYNHFAGTFIPNSPFFIEVALAEKEMDSYGGDRSGANNLIYLARKSPSNRWLVKPEDGFLNFINSVFVDPVMYFAQANDNTSGGAGPGSNPFLGHLKFGFNTPYVNYVTGFNYAKPDARKAIIWKTVDDGWDAGFQHVGGFSQFSLGEKVSKIGDLTLDIGFAPNKTADRKGTKFGYWGWAGIKYNDLVVDFQTNGMYDGKYMFLDAVEHDFILGAKDAIALGEGKLKVAGQLLLATHQMSSKKIAKISETNTTDYFGYSTDVFYRTGNFNAKNIAANVQAGYETEIFGVNLEYRLRGAQASMLYVRQNHDGGTFDLSAQLGKLNSQRVAFKGFVKPIEPLKISLGMKMDMPFERMKESNAFAQRYMNNGWPKRDGPEGMQGWYTDRFGKKPLFGIMGGTEGSINPSAEYAFDENMTLSGYANMRFKAYTYEAGKDATAKNRYGASDSAFHFQNFGLVFGMKEVTSVIDAVNVYYGLDNGNSERMFNTLAGTVGLPGDLTVSASIGVKTIKDTKKAQAKFKRQESLNNPFGFAVGASKKLATFKKPIVYTQFVFNMDPYKHFGSGQEGLNLNGANLNGSWQSEIDPKEGSANVDPVDWYDGQAAFRIGIRWAF